MADFRKLFLALIAGALLFGTVASAEDVVCTVTAVPTTVRVEGVADFVGDVVLNCGDINQAQGSGIIANIKLQLLGGKITSKLLNSATPPVSEATLVLDDTNQWTACTTTVGPFYHPNCNGTYPLVRVPNTFVPKGYQTAVSTPYGDGTQNVYQAVQLSDDTVEWQGVVIAGPGSNISGRSIRLTNVRGYLVGGIAGQSIQAQVTITSPSSIALTPSRTVIVADIMRGLTVTYNPLSVNNCNESGTHYPSTLGTITVNFAEGYGMAFKPRWNNWLGSTPPPAVPHWNPGGAYLDESGYNPLWSVAGTAPPSSGSLAGGGSLVAATSIGVATNGTKFRVVITNVPVGVGLTATSSFTSANGLQISAAQTSTTAGGFQTYTFTWTVTGYGSPASAQYLSDVIAATITVTNNNAPFDPAPVTTNTVMAHGRFWPHTTPVMVASQDTSSETDDVPRFVDSPTSDDREVLVITQNCRTVLLFPYLVNMGSSWDSGIAIANTSKDNPVFSTVNQSGACTLYFFGQVNGAALTSAQAVQTTPVVPAGGMFVMNLGCTAGTCGAVLNPAGGSVACSSGQCTLPGFYGYMIAACNFQYAHGFAFISDVGAQKLAQGYLALVIPDRNTGRAAMSHAYFPGVNQGEQLGN